MGLLHLVKEHHGVGFSPHGLRQLAALVVAHISGRRSDEPGHGVLLHVLAHVDADHIVLIVEQRLRQGLGQLRLAHAGGAQEQEGADGLGGILDARLGAENGLRHLLHALVLADHPLVEQFVQMKGLAALALRQLRHRNVSPLGHNAGDLVLGHTLVHQAQILVLHPLLLLIQLFLQLRQFAVLQLRRLVQVISLLGLLDLPVHLLDLLPQGGQFIHRRLLILPLGLLGRKFIVELRQLLLQIRQSLPAQAVGLLLEGRLLDLHLHDLPGQLIQLRGHGVQLRLHHGTGLVHQVDGLVRQETVADVPVGQHRRRHQGRVRDLHPVVHFVPLF